MDRKCGLNVLPSLRMAIRYLYLGGMSSVFLDKSLFAATLNVESGEQTFLFVKQAKVDCFFDFCLKKVSSQ